MSGKTSIIVVSTFVAGFALGCGSDPAALPKTAAATESNRPTPVQIFVPTSAQTAPKANSASPTYGVVHIDDRILKACGDIPKTQFGFDSADIDPVASSSLAALARCFTSGALAGRG